MFNKQQYLQKKYIPNYLTILRIVLMIIVIIFLLVPSNYILYRLPLDVSISHVLTSNISVNDLVAAIFFAIASCTDFLDGYLARKYHWISDFGKLWDPLADKLLVNGVLICFAYLQLIPIWLTVILILRDFIVDAFRMEALRRNLVVSASWFGKLKTVCQMVGLVFIFFFFRTTYFTAYLTNQVVQWYLIQNLLMLFALFFSLLSMVKYILDIQHKLKKKEVEQSVIE